MKKRFITMALVGTLATSSLGGTAVFASQQSKDILNNGTIKQSVNIVSGKNSEASKETKSLNLNFDTKKFELIQCKGETIISLMDKSEKEGRNYNVFLSWQYIGNTTLKEAADARVKELKSFGANATIEKSDLAIESIKVVDKYEDNSSMYTYFVNDGEGGVYKIFVNTMAFNKLSTKTEMTNILNSIKLIDKEKSILKIKTVEPFLG